MELFIKVLTKIDVDRRFLFPDGCLSALPRSEGLHGITLQVKDDVGILWNFSCVKRSGAVQKMVIVSGWFQFVQSKDLHSGDIVSLSREDDMFTGAAQYKIEVKKSNTSSSVDRKEILA